MACLPKALIEVCFFLEINYLFKIFILPFLPPELPESRLLLKESLCRGTLRTVAALGAGDAHLRGLLLYHLHAALAERARRHPDLYEVRGIGDKNGFTGDLNLT